METTTKGTALDAGLEARLVKVEGTLELQQTLIHTLYDQLVAQQKVIVELQRRATATSAQGWKRGN